MTDETLMHAVRSGDVAKLGILLEPLPNHLAARLIELAGPRHALQPLGG